MKQGNYLEAKVVEAMADKHIHYPQLKGSHPQAQNWIFPIKKDIFAQVRKVLTTRQGGDRGRYEDALDSVQLNWVSGRASCVGRGGEPIPTRVSRPVMVFKQARTFHERRRSRHLCFGSLMSQLVEVLMSRQRVYCNDLTETHVQDP